MHWRPRKVGIFRTSGVTIYESTRLIKAAKKALPKVQSPTLIVHSTEDDTASVKNAHFVAKTHLIKSRGDVPGG